VATQPDTHPSTPSRVDSPQSTDPLPPIDYAARWRALVAGRDAQRGAGYRDGDAVRDPWRNRADRFAAYSDRLPEDDPLFARLRALVRPSDTILDVGAGAGRYALPLARLARSVVAVEPSPAMRHHLEARIAAEAVDNITVVPTAWPDAVVELADIVLCAHVVYGVREIAPFMQAIDAHTRRACLVAIRVDQHPGLGELTAALYGTPHLRQPALLDLYPLLADLGIVADVQTYPAAGSFRFVDRDAALAHYRDRLHVPPGTPAEATLRALLATHLIQDPDGRYRWPGPLPRNAVVTWTKG
jgi:SAM-dependent methyltransferase